LKYLSLNFGAKKTRDPAPIAVRKRRRKFNSMFQKLFRPLSVKLRKITSAKVIKFNNVAFIIPTLE
jgi:hypothetical protein